MDNKMPLDKKGLYIILAGLGLMLLGFILLSGGGVKDPQVFNYDMFDFRRLVLAPIVLVAGIVCIVVALIRKAK
ncbi:MAG: DUF3098 domain-containing protein [Candidatus Cryptobacteroides sp.]